MRFRVKTITTHAINHLLILPKPVGDMLKTNEILKQSIAILISSFRSIEFRIKVNRFQGLDSQCRKLGHRVLQPPDPAKDGLVQKGLDIASISEIWSSSH